jgi:hypothetical protein
VVEEVVSDQDYITDEEEADQKSKAEEEDKK